MKNLSVFTNNPWRILLGITTLLAMNMTQAQTLHVADDAYINSSQAGRNTGSARKIRIDDTRRAESSGFVRFDLSPLPANLTGADIERATLALWVGNLQSAGELALHQVIGDWKESEITAGNAPAIEVAFTTLPVPSDSEDDYLTVDVTDVVRTWLDGAPNQGIALLPQNLAIRLDSKENTRTSHPMEIKVVTIGPQGPQGDPGPQGPQGNPGLGSSRIGASPIGFPDITVLGSSGSPDPISSLTVSCPNNQLAVAGGFTSNPPTVVVTRSARSGASFWDFTFRNLGDSSATVTPSLTCATP